MELPTYFEDFLKDIRPTESQRKTMAEEHKLLRARLDTEHQLLLERLQADSQIGPILLGTFIQGSYRRNTGVKGGLGHCCDVDIVVVTSLPKNKYTARHTLDLFQPFLEKHYPNQYKEQDRSWCIQIDDEVKLDLVPTSEPEEQALKFMRSNVLGDWNFPEPEKDHKTGLILSSNQVILKRASQEAAWDVGEPLWIPNKQALNWDRTHPLFQIKWSATKNQRCDGHYVNVVKALKWWKRFQAADPKYPKGYPLEHIISISCPDKLNSVAQGIVLTLEDIRDRYEMNAIARQTPKLPDRALPENDVLARIKGQDFAAFHANITAAASKAREAYDEDDRSRSAQLWRELLGDPFPVPPPSKDMGYTEATGPAVVAGSRFA